MNFTTFDVDPRSPEWFMLRAGLVTGSCAPAILAVRKKGTGELAVRRELRHRIMCERLTGMPIERDLSKVEAVQHGCEVEPDAVAAYEAHTGQIVRRVGFVRHNLLAAGCSPDGYVGDWQGILEAKCPNSTTHLEYLQANAIPEEYLGQLIHALWLTGAQWADFISYDPRFQIPHLQLFIKRLERSAVDLTAYELAVSLFLTEVENDVAVLSRQAVAV